MTVKTKLCVSFLRNRPCINSGNCTYAHSTDELIPCTICTRENLCGQIHKDVETVEEYLQRSSISRIKEYASHRSTTPPSPFPSFPPTTFDYMPAAIVQDSYMYEVSRITSSSTSDLEDYLIILSKLHFLGLVKLQLIRSLQLSFPPIFPSSDSACLWLNNIVATSKTDPSFNLESLGNTELKARVTNYIQMCNAID